MRFKLAVIFHWHMHLLIYVLLLSTVLTLYKYCIYQKLSDCIKLTPWIKLNITTGRTGGSGSFRTPLCWHMDLTTYSLSCWPDPNIKEACAVTRSHESWGPVLPSGHALLSTDNIIRHTERSPSLSVPHSSSASWYILQCSLCECPHKEGLCGAETQTVLLFWPFVCSDGSCVGVWTVSL